MFKGTFILICFVLSDIGFFYTINFLYQEYRLEQNHIETFGYIINKKTEKIEIYLIKGSRRGRRVDTKKLYYTVNYIFKANDAKIYMDTKYVSKDFFDQIKDNTMVTVLYSPDNPQQNKITQQAYWENILPLRYQDLLIAYSICFVFLYMQFIEIKKYRICKNGIITNAMISHIYYHLTNNRKYDISYIFTDTNNVPFTTQLKSQTTDETDPVKFEKNQNIQIVYSVLNPKKHFIVFPKKIDIAQYIT